MKFERATVLELGARGRLRKAAFELVGRTCVRSASGGVWNEWTARFDDGRTGVLAEARGAFVMYFEEPIVPPYEGLVAGAPLETGFVVAERGKATRIARVGETFDGPRSYRYVDLSSRTGESATLDYGAREPRVFVGRRSTLAELGLSPRSGRPRFVPAPIGERPRDLELVLAVGDAGALGGARWRVTGILHRSIRAERRRYTWQEYLLFEASGGFRWLVVSDGHFSLVESIEPGLVTRGERSPGHVTYGGDRYDAWSEGVARVEWAAGELPWQVAIGEEVRSADFVRPPHMLSFEGTDDEINWSLATYVAPDAVAKAFGKRALPKPIGRAPNQPRSSRRT